MANVTISDLPSLSTMTDSAVIPVDTGANTFQISGANLKNYFSTGGSELVNDDNSFALQSDGNVVFSGPIGGVNRGLVWDYGAVANGVNSEVRQDNNGLTVRAWTEVGMGGVYSAPVNIVTNQDANAKTWTFDGDGNLTLPGNLIISEGNIVSATFSLAFNSEITGITTGNATVIVTLADSVFGDPVQGEVTISDVTGTTEANGVWGYQATESNEFQLYTDATLTTPVDGTTWTAYVSGGTAVSVGTYTDFIIQGGNVAIGSNDNIWVFDDIGNLTLPQGGVVYETGIPFGGLSGNTIALKPSGGTNADQQLLIYPTAGQDFNHLHLTSGNLYNTELFLGDDNFNVKLSNTGNIVINSNDDTGNVGTWIFDTNGQLTLPNAGNIAVAGEAQVGSSLVIETGSAYGDTAVSIASDPTLVSTYLPGGTITFQDGDVRTIVQIDDYPGGTDIFWNTSKTGTLFPITLKTSNYVPAMPPQQWTFGLDGTLTAPGNITTTGNITGGNLITAGNVYAPAIINNGAYNTQIELGAASGIIAFTTYGNSTQFLPGGQIRLNGAKTIYGGTLDGSQLVLGTVQTDLVQNRGGPVTVQVGTEGTTTKTWTFTNSGNLTLPEGGIVTNNISPVTFDILYQYDDLVWSGNTLTFTNASSTYMLGVLALMEVGDAITLGSTATTVTGVYTGGGAGTFTVSGTGAGQQIAQFTLPNRLTSVNGIKLTTNSKNYLFTEAGVTQSPVLTVDTLPSGQFAIAGFRAFVSDANLAPVGNFGAIVGNSGSNTVCVWCDGTNWRIG